MSFQDYSESVSAKLHMGKVKIAAIVGACVLIFIVSVIAISSIASIGSGFEISKASAEDMQAMNDDESNSEVDLEQSEICIDVAGHVNKPGICYLQEGSRVADAVAAAGGFAESAATSAVNQARVLTDGEQLYVPGIDEVTGAGNVLEVTSSGGTSNGKVNINTADSAQLQTISGIGQSKADKIIAYRNANGPFASVDDLVNVSGIGEKTLESIRDSICV